MYTMPVQGLSISYKFVGKNFGAAVDKKGLRCYIINAVSVG
jgi:hypothetical protein